MRNRYAKAILYFALLCSVILGFRQLDVSASWNGFDLIALVENSNKANNFTGVASSTIVSSDCIPEVATSFQQPVGTPAGSGFRISREYNAYKMEVRYRKYHAGEDWTTIGATELAAGKPVFSVANGLIVKVVPPSQLNYPGGSVIVEHRFSDLNTFYSVYSHVNPQTTEGKCIQKGEKIAEIWDSGEASHLHFEFRENMLMSTTLGIGPGYYINPDPGQRGFHDPSSFMARRNNIYLLPVRLKVINTESLNVRSSPEVAQNNVIATLSNGTEIIGIERIVVSRPVPSTQYTPPRYIVGDGFLWYQITQFDPEQPDRLGWVTGIDFERNEATAYTRASVYISELGRACPFELFCDISPSHAFYEEIKYLKANDYVSGYSDGYYLAGNTITRGESARILFRWLYGRNPELTELISSCPNTYFSDMQAYCGEGGNALELVTAVDYLYRRGITKGFSDNTFRPDAEITRGEMMSLIMRTIRQERNIDLLALADDPNYVPINFTDLDPQDVHKNSIEWGARIGLIDGYSDGTFGSGNPISRGEFSKIIARAILYVERPDTNTIRGKTICELLGTCDSESQQMSLQMRASAKTSSLDVYCFPAAAGVPMPGASVVADDTPTCYWNSHGEFRVIEDLPPAHWSRGNIERLFAAGITEGCNRSEGRLFCPDRDTTRLETVIFLLRARHYHQTGQSGMNFTPPTATRQIFDDVPLSHGWVDWINYAYDIGLTQGSPDCGSGTNFCPDIPVTRLQMALFLLRAREGQNYVNNLPYALGVFEDMPATAGHAAAIEDLYWQGITNGSPDCGTGLRYCPGDSVSRGHAAAFIVRTFIDRPVATPRVGDVCFSAGSSFSIPRIGGGYSLPDVDDEDIVCYHESVNQFKMYFNGSANGAGNINIDAFSIYNDQSIWFSTSSSEEMPDGVSVEDEDITVFENGHFRRVVHGDDMPGLGSEDVDALHVRDSSTLYVSLSGGGDVPWELEDEDLADLDPGRRDFDEFFDGSDLAITQDIDGVSITSYSSPTTIYFSYNVDACIPTGKGDLCVAEGDIVRFDGNSGASTSGTIKPTVCFDASNYPGIELIEVDGIHIENDLACDPPMARLQAPGILALGPDIVEFSTVYGDANPSSQAFSIKNLGSGTLNWTIRESVDWLTVSGTLSGSGAQMVDLQVDTTDLAPGSYVGYVYISASGAQDGEQSIPVILELAASCHSLDVFLDPAQAGNVTIDPPANCDGGGYATGTSVTFQAYPAMGYYFTNWDGPVSFGDDTSPIITLTINADTVLTANYARHSCHTLTLQSNPPQGGTVTTDSPNCGNMYTAGTYWVQAVPNEGYVFKEWSGDASGTAAQTIVDVNGDKTTVAHFEQLTPTPTSTTTPSPADTATPVPSHTPTATATSTPDSGAQARLSCRVEQSSLQLNAQTRLVIEVTNAVNLYGYDMRLSYEPSRIQMIDAIPGEEGVNFALGNFVVPDFVVRNLADNSTGQAQIALTQVGGQPASGTGELASISVAGVQQGSTSLTLHDVILSDQKGQTQPVTLQGCSINIIGNAATPSPTPTRQPTSTPLPSPTPTRTPQPAGEALYLPSVVRMGPVNRSVEQDNTWLYLPFLNR